MKFYYLCLLILPFFISCSDATNLNVSDASNSASKFSSYDKETVDTLPFNKSNPYDDAGKIQNEVLERYYVDSILPTTVSGIAAKVSSLSVENSTFVSFGSSYAFSAVERVTYITSHSDTCSAEIICNSLDTDVAKDSLADFITTVLSLCETEDEYEVIYDYIVAYEASVLKSDSFTERDKRVVLTTTSVARHSAYYRKKRPKKNKDPEWDLMVGNIIAATDGATSGIQESVMRALIVGIAQN